MDAGGSGTVTLHQLVGALRHESISLPEDAVQTLVAGIEGRGSGAVDYDSFVATCLQRNRLAKADLLLQACQLLDRDASGFLPKADLLAALD
ncbi:calcium-dependent protein kinase 17-like protein, partial [Haematococcus lacustris]